MIDIIRLENLDKWDEIVKSFVNHDVYYLNGYVKAFALHGDGDPILINYHSENGRAICVLMLRDVANDQRFAGKIPQGKFFDAVTPYGYGGFLEEGEVDEMRLSKELEETLKDLRVISVFYRFHPVLNNAKELPPILSTIPLGKTIALDLSSPQIIWENIISKNRNMIRKAEKSNVKISHTDDPTLLKIFKEIYDKTMTEDNADEYYYFKDEFYKSIANDLRGNYQIFYASYDDKIISMAIIIFANNQMHYHLSGSIREYRSLAPSNLLLYKAALWGYEQGFKTFHLGGGVGSGEDPLYKFKAAFNRNSDYRFSIGKSITNNDAYHFLIDLRKSFDNSFNTHSGYFPVYRS